MNQVFEGISWSDFRFLGSHWISCWISIFRCQSLNEIMKKYPIFATNTFQTQWSHNSNDQTRILFCHSSLKIYYTPLPQTLYFHISSTALENPSFDIPANDDTTQHSSVPPVKVLHIYCLLLYVLSLSAFSLYLHHRVS